MKKKLEDRFWLKVKKTSDCWLWTGCLYGFGKWKYGQIYGDGKIQRAHRYSYELHVGPIAKGLCVCHKCDNPLCVNPNHLFLGTHKENLGDMSKKGRAPWGEKSYRAKLTNKDIIKIRNMKKPQSVIAEKFGIGQSNVSYIKSRKTWTHI